MHEIKLRKCERGETTKNLSLAAFVSFASTFLQLSFSPTTPGWSHFRLIALLSSIFSISGVMFVMSIAFGLFNGINMFAFMGAEVRIYLRCFC